jgi:hypothetical protein
MYSQKKMDGGTGMKDAACRRNEGAVARALVGPAPGTKSATDLRPPYYTVPNSPVLWAFVRPCLE